ncbi:multi-sensor hybrid histidine kinase [Kalymmatonema gypsitolerans NIES-4073]|nr:multi-sensor hybrid histidine kinase [Scytonema sp. NIES-4073]
MKDEEKTKEQLIEELAALRQHLSQLEQLASLQPVAEEALRQQYERERRQQKEQALNRVIQSIRNSLDLETIFSTAVYEITQLVPADRVEIVQYLPERQLWLNVADYHQIPDLPSALGLEIPDVDNEIAARLKRLEVVQIEDASACSDEINRNFAQTYQGAWLLVPVHFGSTLWGSLSLIRNNHSFSWQQEEVELTCAVADQLAIAIQQSTLLLQLQTELAERKQVEAALQEKQYLIERIVETSPDLIYVYDLVEQRNIYVNRQAVEILGYTSQQIEAMREAVLPNLVHPHDMPRVTEYHKRFESVKEGEVLELEYRMRDGHGEWRWLRSRDTVFSKNANGLPVQVLGIAIDITERKQAEAAIYFQAHLLSTVEQAVIATNLDGEIIYWNRFAEILYGWSAVEVIGQNILEVVPAETSQEQAAQIMSQLQRGESWSGEFLVRRRDGTLFPILITDSPIHDDKGELVGIVGISIDITVRKNAIAALQESEERFRTMADTAPVMIWMAGIDQFCHYLNKGWLEFTGRRLEQEIGDGWTELVHPDDLEFCLETYTTAFDARRSFTMEYRLKRFDGEYRWLLDTGTPRFHSDGSFAGYIGSCMDITEQKLTLEALQDSEARLRLTLEAARMVTWDWNITTNNVVDYNPMEPLCGLALGSHDHTLEAFLDAVYPEDRDRVLAAITDAIENRTDYEAEFRLVSPDGALHWIGNKGQVYYDETGRAVRMIGVAMDITERKRAEQKIREQAAWLDVATDAIVVRDLENKIVFWNRSAERLYGWKVQEALGKDANELLFKETSSQVEEALHQVHLTGEWYGELHKVMKDGKEIIVESRWTLVRDERGNPKSILAVDTDITQKKQLEAQFLRAQRLESLGTLASGIAHDLNNILAPMLMSAQLLRMRISDEQNQLLLETLETNAQRGATLVKQVLSFARGVEGRRTILQLRHLILEIEQFAKQTFPKSIEFCTDIAPNLWTVSGDGTQLHQVLINLVINARDAMPNGGVLSISAENFLIDENYARMNLDATVGPHIVITVRDTGIGMSREILDRIFEPFFTTKEVAKGSGLGLSTVLGIMKSHRGFISVSSTVGKGTEFQVFLKAVLENETPPAETLKLPAGNGELILVVDDEAEIQEITKITLSSYNYKVLTACDGIEALALYAQHREEIKVVFVDMMMPVMDGLTTIRALLKMNPCVKIMAASGLSDNKQRTEALGVETFLPKPYTVKQLLQALHKFLN